VPQNPQDDQGVADNANYVMDDVQSVDGGAIEVEAQQIGIQSPVADKLLLG
jgi:hypothetical protein